jgi:hypothetical protein
MGISLEQALKRCDFRGVRALPLFAPLDAFPRPLTPHRLAGKCCQSGVIGHLFKTSRLRLSFCVIFICSFHLFIYIFAS